MTDNAQLCITNAPSATRLTQQDCIEMAQTLTFDTASTMVRRLRRTHQMEADYLSQAFEKCLKSPAVLADLIKQEQGTSMTIFRCFNIYQQCLADDEASNQRNTETARTILTGFGNFLARMQGGQQQQQS